jgi:hypothetical protein
VAEFSGLCALYAPGMAVGLARLPYLARPPETGGAPRADDPDTSPTVVFASQAKVPVSREERREVLLALAAAAFPRPPLVKLRAESGEEQTHRETWPYPALWAELVAEGLVKPDAVRFSTGAMSDALHEAAGLATISSTAVLEAIAAGVPVLAISDFGVSPELINVVFEGSGCLGTLDDLRHGRYRVPDQAWLTDNYFHPATDDTWFDILSALLTQRRAGLPGRSVSRYGSRSAQLRRSLRLVLPRRFWSSASR